MRWFRIREAKIPEQERDLFDRYGETVIASCLSGGFHPAVEDLHPLYSNTVTQAHARDWLTEERDRAHRRETWSTAMEAAITVLVSAELIFSVLDFFFRKR